MANKRLSEKDIDQLLVQYRSERRRLSFQLETVREAINELKAAMTGGTTARKSPAKRATTAAKKAAKAAKKPRRKPGRKKKRVIKDGGYRLSPWDVMVIDTIKAKNRLLPKEDIVKAALAWAKKNEPAMKQPEVEAKITRVLQKLSGKRGELGTHRSGLRRGYHYGIKDWFFASSGVLRKQHYDKLVLVEEGK